MRSIFRTIAFALTLLATVSCNIDFIYLQVPGTSWSLEQGETRAFAHFDSERVTIVQRSSATGGVQFTNGTYLTDGHRVKVTSDEGTSHQLVRTFTHLKSGTSNKNFSSLRPQSYETLDGTVWTTLRQDDLTLYYFEPGGKSRHWTFKNVRHEEGVPYGWEAGEETYSVTGSHVALESGGATLFPEVMLMDDVWYMHYPAQEDNGTSALRGTAWKYVTNSYPGILIFNTNSSFTRVLVSSRVLYQVTQGTYTVNGDSVTLSFSDKSETCTISGNRFTFMERTYELFQ